MTGKRETYHHGDLRAALIAGAEEMLAETGAEGFSLRHLAKRVGVSHSAPAHHFGDAHGLLCALAAAGFRRLLAAMEAREAGAGPDPASRLLASGLGYVDFAESAPALFQLMFGSLRDGREPPELTEAAATALGHLAGLVTRHRGGGPAAAVDMIACWSTVHGFAELSLAGRLRTLVSPGKAKRDEILLDIMRRALA